MDLIQDAQKQETEEELEWSRHSDLILDLHLLFETELNFFSGGNSNLWLIQTMQHWRNIARLIPGSSEDSCMFKILGLKKINLADQKWS